MRTQQPVENPAHPALLSVVTPAYNEQHNLPVLYQRLNDALAEQQLQWEWIVIDDHSSDGSFERLRSLAAQDPRVVAVRLARNSGSHAAVNCGLRRAKGDCAVVLAADLQDPPETISALIRKWRDGAQIVWAVRAEREGESLGTRGFARLYYWLMRRIVGFKEMPPTGADFFLADRRVLDILAQFNETNVSLLALLTWMGFRQAKILYTKQARLHGKSGWTLEKKLKLVVDSVTSFSYLPLRFMAYLGFAVAGLGFLYSLFVISNAMLGAPVAGWSSLMVVVLVIGGIQMMMMGMLGEYVWRALDESRRRPRFIIEDEIIGAAGAEIESTD